MVKNLRLLREERRLTQRQLAERMGVSQQSIYKYENGMAEPDIDTLIAFADYFYTSVDYLIGHDDGELFYAVEPLSPKEIHHIKVYRRLSNVLREYITKIIEEFVSINNK